MKIMWIKNTANENLERKLIKLYDGIFFIREINSNRHVEIRNMNGMSYHKMYVYLWLNSKIWNAAVIIMQKTMVKIRMCDLILFNNPFFIRYPVIKYIP